MIPYARQSVDEDDIRAVAAVLRSDWLTTGPVVPAFEKAVDRGAVFAALRAAGVGTNVHDIPVHLHPFYRERLGTGPGLCPAAEAAYERILSLPMFPGLRDADLRQVVAAIGDVVPRCRKAGA